MRRRMQAADDTLHAVPEEEWKRLYTMSAAEQRLPGM
jgi:hypothetical protein